tara:strand:+ start:225 stop:1136 length:912 start_codon:yes stop_codon:yes gene_type:complete
MAIIKKVGFVGTGIMGAPMARNIAQSGFQVSVYNRTAEKANPLKEFGIKIAKSIPELAKDSDIVITMVSDTPDVLEVIEGPNGIAQNLAAGSTIIDMSTISPSATKELSSRLSSIGLSMLDAPVSGGSWGAEQGTLAIMVGGDEAVLSLCLPVLESMGQRITHMGSNGMGQTTKLVNQILVAGTLSAVAEAMVFAAAHGSDLEKTIEAVGSGAAGSWQLNNLGPRMINGDFAPGFMIKLQQKDLRLVLEAGYSSNVPLAVTELSKDWLDLAESLGASEEGTQAVIKSVEKLAGVVARHPTSSN